VGMQITLYTWCLLIKSKPLTEFPRSWRALIVLFVLEVTTAMCLSHDNLWSK
jgi:hypothetical protein